MTDQHEKSASPGRVLLPEQLFGREVRDTGKQVLGRILDICAGDEGGDFVVRHYLVGPVRSSSRLSVGNVWYRMLALLGLPLGARSYAVPWYDMDLSDPLRPRVRRARGALPLAGPAAEPPNPRR